MKSKTLMAALFLAGTTAFASTVGEIAESGKGVAVVRQGSVFNLIYKAESASTVTVQIYSPEHRLILTEHHRNVDGFARPYNFTGMKKGVYTVMVKDGHDVRMQEFNYDQNSKEKLMNLVKLTGEDKYLLTAGGQGEEQIILNIYDGLDNLLHKETKRIAGEFGQVYNLKRVGSKVKFEVIHENGKVETLQ